MLAAVYKSSELFLLQDKSENFDETWRFVDRRLNDAGDVGRTMKKVIYGSAKE